MPPKMKVTKEEIIYNAVEITRESGWESMNARLIAQRMHTSTQPIFSNFRSMDELREAVIQAADMRYQDYTEREIKSGKYPEYKATGVAYIRFAKEEKELFKLLFMRDRTKEKIPPLSNFISDIVQTNTGLNQESAELFHLKMWAFVHGIAVMTATNYQELDESLISQLCSDVYQALKKQIQGEQG